MKGQHSRHISHQRLPSSLSVSFVEDTSTPSYRLTAINEDVRRVIETRFHKSKVNATYVFPRKPPPRKVLHRPAASLSQSFAFQLKSQTKGRGQLSETLTLPVIPLGVSTLSDSQTTLKRGALKRLIANYTDFYSLDSMLHVRKSEVEQVRKNLRGL